MSYALVQKSLDQFIDRKTMEEASVFVPSVARGDCARLHRDLFGIVLTGLSHDEAIAFQVALEHFNYPTDVVPDAEIPSLPAPVFRRGIRFENGQFTALDGLGREDRYAWSDVQFAGGGFMQTVQVKAERRIAWNPNARRYSRYNANVSSAFVVKKKETETPAQEFRLDLFLSREPYRLQFRANKDSMFRCDGAMLRFRQHDAFTRLLQRVAEHLPRSRASLGLIAAREGRPFAYPSPAASEEEVSWHILQGRRQAKS